MSQWPRMLLYVQRGDTIYPGRFQVCCEEFGVLKHCSLQEGHCAIAYLPNQSYGTRPTASGPPFPQLETEAHTERRNALTKITHLACDGARLQALVLIIPNARFLAMMHTFCTTGEICHHLSQRFSTSGTPFGKPLSPKILAVRFITVSKWQFWSRNKNNCMVGGQHDMRSCAKGLHS